MPLSFADVREMALALPGVEDGTSYGTAALKVRGRLLVRLKEDGATVVVHAAFDEREMLMEAEPQTFFITEHYRPYPLVLVRLESVAPGTLARLIAQHWREVAPRTLVQDYDARNP